MSDGSKRNLSMPNWHVPYLEKHRIDSLFRELARELVIQQPDDHVHFLKQILTHASQNLDVAKVILISSPKVNTYEIAKQMGELTKQVAVSENALLTCMGIRKTMPHDNDAKFVANCINQLVRTAQARKYGWILTVQAESFIGCIRTVAEAKAIVQLGILPTHVIHLIPPFSPSLDENLYCHVPVGWPEYRRSVLGIRNVFKNTLQELHIGEQDMTDVLVQCLNLQKVRKGHGGPIKPRIILIGPRGSGRKTQAKLLMETNDIVHVEFEYLLCQACNWDTPMGKNLRLFKNQVCSQSNLLAQVINKRILEKDCLEHGWVLTGFPFTTTDLRYLDCLDTPPNRVIFMECDISICAERILHRRVNVDTGSFTNILEEEVPVGKVMALHPKDTPAVFQEEVRHYCQNYEALKSYCGDTAKMVNAEQPIRWVNECIITIILQELDPGPPRNPCTGEDYFQLLETPDFFSDGPTKPNISYLKSFVCQI